jgi:anion-transporting  ArsA/GET3 family ATPase
VPVTFASSRGDLFSKRLVVVAGKGGVGRTTLAAAIAVAAVRRGKRVLLCQVNAKERLSTLLGLNFQVGDDITLVRPGLWAINMNARAAIKEYGLMVLRFQSVYKAVFENKMVKSFLRAIPGLDDWSMIGKTWYHTTEEENGRPRFDLVVLDGPATGHLLSLLAMPQVVLEAVPRGPMTKDATAIRELLTDPDRCSVEICTLLEEMPVNEAGDLFRALTARLGLPMGRLFLNRVLPIRFRGDDVDAVMKNLTAELSSLAAQKPRDALTTALLAARPRRTAQAMQAHYLGRVAEQVPLPRVSLPMLFSASFGPAELEHLSQVVEQAAFVPAGAEVAASAGAAEGRA